MRGVEVGVALLVEYFDELPQPAPGDSSQAWAAKMQGALETFQEKVKARYSEATLQRLLHSTEVRGRRAAVLALGLLGTMDSNARVAALLHDDDRIVRQLAVDSLWSLWFRADTDGHNRELRRLMSINEPEKALAGFEALIKKAPAYAEAYNQRAILYFRLEEFQRSVADCERVLKLNPHHFGAQSGMAQCYMKLKKPRSALSAYRKALAINPNLDGVEETIHFLENALGEEGRKDDKK
jgi:tetratricopeptide (TPR) repeat protein